MQRKLFPLNEEVEFVEFSNLLAPPLIEAYNLLEVNLLLHKCPEFFFFDGYYLARLEI